MKKIVIMLFLSVVVTRCKRTSVDPYQSRGILTGYDFGACAFCGGIKITIQNDTTMNAPPFYRIDTTLSQLGINKNTAFPINVQLNWQRRLGSNPGNYIIVSRIMQTR